VGHIAYDLVKSEAAEKKEEVKEEEKKEEEEEPLTSDDAIQAKFQKNKDKKNQALIKMVLESNLLSGGVET
jgi:hypothetical protein